MPDDDSFYFNGNIRLINLVRKLYARRSRKDKRTRPLICLIRREDAAPVLPALQRKFQPIDHAGLVVHHKLSRTDKQSEQDETTLPPATEQDVRDVRSLLTELARKLGGVGDERRRLRRFRRFTLTVRIMEQDLGPDFNQAAGEKKIRDWLRDPQVNLYQEAPIPNDLDVPGWLYALAKFLRFLWFRARVSGRVPLLSGYYRWFRHKHSLAPLQAKSMPAVAAALTKRNGGWCSDPELILLFMVNAFMQDIRVAYRGGRRTACATLLLSDITRNNGGYQLLRAINDVRNLIPLPDPLLVITEGHRRPPFAKPPSTALPVEEAQHEYEHWLRRIAPDQHRLEDTAWYLPLTVPPVATDPDARAVHVARYEGAPGIEQPGERRYLQGVKALAVAAALAGAAWSYGHYSVTHCGTGLSWPGFEPTVWQTNGGECVGVTDGTNRVFADVSDQIDTIVEQNKLTEAQHSSQPTRPVLTLVYLDILDTPYSGPGSLATERENLKGVAVAQKWQLNTEDGTQPLIRVLIANGGQGMSSGPDVARTIISLAKKDPSIVGVVGLNGSYQKTLDTASVLAQAEIPSIGTTISADVFADTLPLYFQTDPQNRREADVVAKYTATSWPPNTPVRIYYSTNPGDLYTNNLALDALASFTKAGFHPELKPFGPNAPGDADRTTSLGDAGVAGSDACQFTGVVFYAGRSQPDFSSFLDAYHNCPTRQPIRIIADDDTTYYVADDVSRQRYVDIGFDYVSFAAPPPLAINGEKNFYNAYNELFKIGPGSPDASKSLDGDAALSYDAAQLLGYAVAQLRFQNSQLPITPAAVWRQIAASRFAGASGFIDFDGDLNRHVPLNKPVLILQVANGQVVPIARAYCGRPANLDPRTEPWCPFDKAR
jgi:hypothetical protein